MPPLDQTDVDNYYLATENRKYRKVLHNILCDLSFARMETMVTESFEDRMEIAIYTLTKIEETLKELERGDHGTTTETG